MADGKQDASHRNIKALESYILNKYSHLDDLKAYVAELEEDIEELEAIAARAEEISGPDHYSVMHALDYLESVESTLAAVQVENERLKKELERALGDDGLRIMNGEEG